MSYYPYALYIDNKIIGALHQLLSFYRDDVFNTNNTIVYLIKRIQSYRRYRNILIRKNIPYRFIKLSDINKLENQTIFYAFHALSNCRVIANRKLKHVFITHGESNKIASIKPILRVYDHVVMAGELSLERYLRSGIFHLHDVKTKRLIQMGNTFIGKTGFNLLSKTSPVLCYAPTWEGEGTTENYSSLGYPHVVNYIYEKAKQLNLNTVVIKPHPNTGCRIKKYLKKLIENAYELVKKDLRVKIYLNDMSHTYFFKSLLKIKDIEIINNTAEYKVAHAFVDISAMETQFINEGIPYNIFYHVRMLRNDVPKAYLELYHSIGINLDQAPVSCSQDANDDLFQTFREKLFSYTDKEWLSLNNHLRVASLVNLISIKNEIT